MSILCNDLAEVRRHIDRLDRQLVALVAERGRYVAQAARLKATAAEVPAPQRVAEVIARVNGIARELGAHPGVVEATWRAMIDAFIACELEAHATPAPPIP